MIEALVEGRVSPFPVAQMNQYTDMQTKLDNEYNSPGSNRSELTCYRFVLSQSIV